MFNKDGKFGYSFWVLQRDSDYIRDRETGLILAYKEKENAIWEAKYYKECRQIDVQVVYLEDSTINYIICDF